jgi:hypothetical protein
VEGLADAIAWVFDIKVLPWAFGFCSSVPSKLVQSRKYTMALFLALFLLLASSVFAQNYGLEC